MPRTKTGKTSFIASPDYMQFSNRRFHCQATRLTTMIQTTTTRLFLLRHGVVFSHLQADPTRSVGVHRVKWAGTKENKRA